MLLIPSKSSCSARSLLNSIDETSKFERIDVGVEIDEIESESAGIEIKDVLAANINNMIFLGDQQYPMETKIILHNITQRVC